MNFDNRKRVSWHQLMFHIKWWVFVIITRLKTSFSPNAAFESGMICSYWLMIIKAFLDFHQKSLGQPFIFTSDLKFKWALDLYFWPIWFLQVPKKIIVRFKYFWWPQRLQNCMIFLYAKTDPPQSVDPQSGDPLSGDPRYGDPRSWEPQSGNP